MSLAIDLVGRPGHGLTEMDQHPNKRVVRMSIAVSFKDIELGRPK